MTTLIITIMLLVGSVIYVWGANGENVCLQRVNGKIDPEGWIKGEESSSSNANRAITLYRTMQTKGIFPILAMDCSGFVCYVLKLLGIIKQSADYNTKGLYSLCNSHPTKEMLRQGDLVFHSKDGTVEGIHHVGIYLGNNKVAESRGRDDGLVITDLDNNPLNWEGSWNMFGRLNKMASFIKEPVEPLPLDVTNPVRAGEGYKTMQLALNQLGYKDNEDNVLVVDGKFGKKSRQAYDNCVAANLGKVSADIVVRLGGAGEVNLLGLEE